MFHPSRGGVRGGADQFEWEDVKADKYRECYLGRNARSHVRFGIKQQPIAIKNKNSLMKRTSLDTNKTCLCNHGVM